MTRAFQIAYVDLDTPSAEQETAYYDNGDMKERVTTELDGNAKTRESWGSLKPNGGRNKSTQTWNGEKNRWD